MTQIHLLAIKELDDEEFILSDLKIMEYYNHSIHTASLL